MTFDYLLPESVSQGETYELTWLRQSGTPRDSLTVIVGDRQFKANAADRLLEVTAKAT